MNILEQHQINEICLRLDALDDDQMDQEDAKNAIRLLSDMGHEYRRPGQWENDLLAAIWTLMAMFTITITFAMFIGS